ncbi:sigma factor-like helix-turn-helix DNA-binding protein [Bacillus thuringiensis]|uniref:sigma factor-like helix-turn-helix DNA-binding protein n=1 Tax=Bacillus cereus group TaxID=86661 RepID=UPI000CD8173A|nr:MULTISPECIES: sigma factor-like helix-turn-helix DNA-binding protein [Bacillus cereus group]MEC3420523.1 sigma factor-like helix-turn-helix DNA-binding protein [Bacillus cereus]MEC3596933.1 sigma factor-like helix-turn-helix DNA-binding protein [Bacillus thuringiensis]MED1574282.1 sigma factor-like helix-turn-helix DNA-binding protein [Bacillus paranthracis]MED1836206.1 sigma factor-like helix-turn-helix DNA-binding protein [Bacillus thuringiensis]MED2670269.1 sigma factor-like helix-turn-h
MGTVNVDLKASERRLDAKYPLDTEAGVMKLLGNIHKVYEARYFTGDFGACDMILDLDVSLAKLELDDMQKRVIWLHFFEDLTQAEVALRVGNTQQGVSYIVQTVVKQLAKYMQEGNEAA